MRPVTKWTVGETIPATGETIKEDYNPYGDANPLLQTNLGSFCSYCELFSSDLEVEHIISKDQDRILETKWNNFLLTCGRCNGMDNKGNKPVDSSTLYLPHNNNTLLAFEYLEGGLVKVNPFLTEPDQISKAENTFNLVGIDKYPGNPKYPPTPKHSQGFPINDKRWEHRRSAWEYAIRKLLDFEQAKINADDVSDFAFQRGCFSIWFSVFNHHQVVKESLILKFEGTAANCFNPNFDPIPRNPGMADPI